MNFLSSLVPVRIGPAGAMAEEQTEDHVVWFIVFIWVLLALAATILVGALIWCFINAHSSLYAVVQLNPWTFKLGCN
ncbi:MAG TPA: hypothetical protein VJT78_00080 [Candidatus Dormibacteraeota bacterium]|nr:hypothetical protein [Candidatus Dormibacteraeota bacterium]